MRLSIKWKFLLKLALCAFVASSCILLYSLWDWNSEVEWNGWSGTTVAFSHHLCVLVPFRDRTEELSQFAPYMQEFLRNQNVRHDFIVLNQTDAFRFNRAALINVGFFEADRLGCDYLVMHDVDLLPVNANISYQFPGVGTVRHISSPEYHPKYNYSKFIGGILMLTTADFRSINGMSNKYWGWGLEDDEFYLRIRDAKFTLERPQNLTTDRRTTFKHIHGPQRKRDYTRLKNQSPIERAEKRRRDLMGGLSNARYRLDDRTSRMFGDSTVHILHIELKCDTKKYPYCVAT